MPVLHCKSARNNRRVPLVPSEAVGRELAAVGGYLRRCSKRTANALPLAPISGGDRSPGGGPRCFRRGRGSLADGAANGIETGRGDTPVPPQLPQSRPRLRPEPLSLERSGRSQSCPDLLSVPIQICYVHGRARDCCLASSHARRLFRRVFRHGAAKMQGKDRRIEILLETRLPVKRYGTIGHGGGGNEMSGHRPAGRPVGQRDDQKVGCFSEAAFLDRYNFPESTKSASSSRCAPRPCAGVHRQIIPTIANRALAK